jgi:cytochrome c oxidase cbb3-type subunit III
MSQDVRSRFGICAGMMLALVVTVGGGSNAIAQQPGTMGLGSREGNPQGSEAVPGALRGNMLEVPLNTIIPGAVSVQPNIKIPTMDDAAAQRGMKAFTAFNCVGCHMGNGGGGMGPALSNRFFIYGSEPQNIYLSIVQGRPKGMPAWGALLPDEIVWDIVAYVKRISDAPVTQWGTTVSAGSPQIEQVPAELQTTINPWQYTQKFSNGQRP